MPIPKITAIAKITHSLENDDLSSPGIAMMYLRDGGDTKKSVEYAVRLAAWCIKYICANVDE